MDRTVWEHPKVSYAGCPISTVHPIPLYHGMDWTDWEYPKASHVVCPIPTVHPIPPYHGTDWTEWECPKASHAGYLSILSVMGGIAHPVLRTPICTVHPILLYCE